MSRWSDTFAASQVGVFLRSGWILSSSADRVLLGWGDGRWSDFADAETASIFAPDFYLKSKKPWWITRHWQPVSTSSLISVLEAWLQTEVSRPELFLSWKEPEFDDFASAFHVIQNSISNRQVMKAVPMVTAKAEALTSDHWRARVILAALKSREKAQRGCVYGFWNDQEGMLGLTPECLFSYRAGGTLNTMALAGTLPLPASQAERDFFIMDPKEQEEHQLVVDDIIAVLNRWGHVEKKAVEILELPHLLHLKTDLRLQLTREFSFSDLVADLHPTPALGVSPRGGGLQWMSTWDSVSTRFRFGAPFGVLWTEDSKVNAECWVAIRNVQWQDKQILLNSGCGVVGKSVLEKEWVELQAKRHAIRRMLDV